MVRRQASRLAAALLVLAASLSVVAYTSPSRVLAGTPAPGWSTSEIDPSGYPPDSEVGTEVSDLACTHAGFCATVGGFGLATMSGGVWSITQLPLPSRNPAGEPPATGSAAGGVLVSVSCASSVFCVAVGGYLDSTSASWGLIEAWNGSIWTPSAAPLPAGDDPDGYPPAPEPYAPPAAAEQSGLSAVSCPGSGSCVAVGQYRDSNGTDWGLVENLSGGAWSASTAPEPASAPDGSIGHGSQADLVAVSCSSPNDCAAAGNYDDAGNAFYGLLEWDDGGSWSSQVAPEPATNRAGEGPGYRSASGASYGFGDALSSLSCGASVCVAIGNYLDAPGFQWGLLESSSNGSWNAVAAPEPASDLSGLGPAAEGDAAGMPDALTAVSCPPSGACVAVGWFDNTDQERWGFALSGSGTTWSPTTVPEPAQSTVGTLAADDADDASSNGLIEDADLLDGVSCWSAGQCLAVGSFASLLPDWYESTTPPSTHASYPMADLLSGGSWNAVAAPTPPDLEFESNQAPLQAQLSGASCAPDGTCAAFGTYPDNYNAPQAMVDGYLEPAPGPPSLTPSGGGTTVNSPPPVSGSLYAFGDNRFGELGTTVGLGDNEYSPERVQLPGATGAVTAVAVGGIASLAATTTGQLYSFGSNEDGELGTSVGLGSLSVNPTATLVNLPGQQGVITDLAAGYWSSYAVTATGQLYAFGSNLYGQLGTASDSHTWLPEPTPTLVALPPGAGGVTQVVAGDSFVVVLTTSGQLYAFGSNDTGALATPTEEGLPTPQPTPAPVELPGAIGSIVQIAAGAGHVLALTSSGQLFAFGDDDLGQLGDGTFGGLGVTPTVVTLPGQQGAVVSIAGGTSHSLVVTSSGQLYAFGDDTDGELGDGGPIHTPGGELHTLVTTPELVTLPSGAAVPVAAEAVGFSSLVLTSSGALWGFGANYFATLGPASTGADVLTPTRIEIDGTAPVLAISAGPAGQQTLAIVDDGIPVVSPAAPPSPTLAPASSATAPTTTTTVPAAGPAGAAQTVPEVVLDGTRLTARGARVQLKVGCRSGTCDGSIRITTRPGSHRGTPLTRVVPLGSASYRLAAGQSEVISVKLDRTGRRLLAEAARHRMLALVSITLNGGGRISTEVVITFRR